jgi:protein-S-isoprenylcysteine O-methyltransferase Ste14
MDLFAVHSFGIFNLWLLMVLYTLPILLTVIFRRHVFGRTSAQFSSSRNTLERRLFIASKFFMLFYFLYAIVLPVRFDSTWAIFGLVIYGIGFAFYAAAWITIATSQRGRVFSGGPFRFSRHPVYLSSAVMFMGAGLASGSWFYLGFSLLVGLSHMRNALAEEQVCLATFGDDYRRYMDTTPRWLGCPAPGPKRNERGSS